MSFGNDALFSEFNVTDTSPQPQQDWMSDDDPISAPSNVNQVLLDENSLLKKENSKLRKTLRLLTHPSKIKIKDVNKDGPVAHVMLFNNTFANENNEVIKDFFSNLLHHSNKRHRQDDVASTPQPSAVQYLTHTKSSKHSKKAHKSFVVTQSYQFFKGNFYLDHVGEPTNEEAQQTDSRYERLYLDVLDSNEGIPQGNSGPSRRPKPPKTCFNCGNPGHEIRECPQPRNQQNINQRRQHFMDSSANNTPPPSTRIYQKDNEVSSEVDDRFKHFKPGSISDDLREALGITKEDLAPYIYQMRWFGYPPGHLHSAQVPNSGLSFYHNSSMAPEPGEDTSDDSSSNIVNIDKIVKYPGFNVPIGNNMIDDHVNLGAPPMDEAHSYDVMVSYYKHQNKILVDKQKSQTPAKTPRHAVTTNLNNEINEVDMDVDHNEENDVKPDLNGTSFEMEHKSLINANIPTTSDNTESIPNGFINNEDGDIVVTESIDDFNSNDLTEDELEKRRQLILKQLEEEDDEVIFIPPPPLPTIDLTSDVKKQVACKNEQLPDDLSSNLDTGDNMLFVAKESTPCLKQNGSIQQDISPIKTESSKSVVMETTSNSIDNGDPMESNVEKSALSIGNNDEIGASSQAELDISDSSVPHRSRFAKGITQFDQFYDETKSRGTYKKLRCLLNKQSPRRIHKGV